MNAVPVVCCVKWGMKYPVDYVNRLHRMVRRCLSRSCEFVCLTEDPAGLEPDIKPIPFPDRDFGGFWNKISLFRPDLFEPGRPLLYLDLDIVIVGPLDPLLEGTADLTIIRGFSRTPSFNSSVMRIVAGSLPHVYDRFAGQAERIVGSGRYAGDQNWIYEQVPGAALFPPGRVVSYKRDLNAHVLPLAKKLGLDVVNAPRWMKVTPPKGASIVVFHGKPDPADVSDGPFGPWKHAPFVAEHWR